ncbi:MAG: hypothetical protein KR126chlam5_00975 [Candidatus Anoxychlamydiales bacterium]|nr:hypothetical protein [Candidatus Anoxychlamydiales bacterium]
MPIPPSTSYQPTPRSGTTSEARNESKPTWLRTIQTLFSDLISSFFALFKTSEKTEFKRYVPPERTEGQKKRSNSSRTPEISSDRSFSKGAELNTKPDNRELFSFKKQINQVFIEINMSLKVQTLDNNEITRQLDEIVNSSPKKLQNELNLYIQLKTRDLTYKRMIDNAKYKIDKIIDQHRNPETQRKLVWELFEGLDPQIKDEITKHLNLKFSR